MYYRKGSGPLGTKGYPDLCSTDLNTWKDETSCMHKYH